MLNIYQLEQRIQSDMREHSIVGLALAIVEGSEVTYARGFGVTSVEDGGLPVTPHTLFCVGSISKTITATLVMRLVEQGRLDLDVPVMSYLPGFAFSDATLGARVTLRHVLSHTTGLPSGGKDFGPRDPDALRRFVWDELARYPFVAEPGRVCLYSNTVIVLAGYVAEVVTGKYYEELVEELVFKPLQMRRSTFDRTVAMTYPLALAHERDEDGTLRTRHRFIDNVSGNPAGFGICSTFDLANFAIMHLNRGQFQDAQILAPESVAEMQRMHIPQYLPGGNAGYGLGLFIGDHHGQRQVSHGGMIESYQCFFRLFPDNGVGVILQTNYGDGEKIFGLVSDIYDQLLGCPPALPEPQVVEPDTTTWTRHAGTYLGVQNGLAQIAVDGQRLVLHQNGETHVLSARKDGLYQTNDMPIAFLDESEEPTEYVIIDGNAYHRFNFDLSFVSDPDAWCSYAGTYGEWPSDPYPIQIRVDDGTLYMRWWGHEDACTPLSTTSFASARGTIDFEVAEDGSVSALILQKASRNERIT